MNIENSMNKTADAPVPSKGKGGARRARHGRRSLYIETRALIVYCAAFILMAVMCILAVMAKMDRHINASVLVALALLVMADFAALLFWVARPYLQSKKGLALFASGYSFDTLFDAKYPVSRQMEGAQQSLSCLIKSTQSLNLSKRQAQFIALQNQINPHFLYNTLEGIRSEALTAGLSSVANIALSLSTFFRYTISQMESLVTLGMELENTQNYFAIQQYRFGNRLNIRIDFDNGCKDEACECKCIKLMLQPIVENAIVHGLEGISWRGELRIKTTLTDSRLLITVSDNGAGMDSAALQKIQQSLMTLSIDDAAPQSLPASSTYGALPKDDINYSQRGHSRGGIALRNVNNRIKIIFGEQYGLNIESHKGLGTDVHISLPRFTDDSQTEAKHRAMKMDGNVKKELLRLEDVYLPPHLNGLSLEIFAGEVCALVSVDHVGLSSLINILLMEKTPLERGKIFIDYSKNNGKVFIISGDSAAQLIDNMTIADNLFVVCPAGSAIIDRNAINQRTRALLASFGLFPDPQSLVSSLSSYEKVIIALAKAHIMHSPLVVLDNITATITMDDVERVMAVVHSFVSSGLAVLYICNHHQEAFRYCDTLNIMERGRITKRMDRLEMEGITASGHEEEYMSRYFRAPYDWAKRNEHKTNTNKAEKIGFWCAIDDLSFSIKKGDVTVLIDNNGTTQKKLQSLLNARSAEANIYVDGHKWDISSRNCVLIPAEPTVSMLFLQMPLIDNLCFTLDDKVRGLWLTRKVRRAVAQDVRGVFGDAIASKNLFGLDEAVLYKIIYQRILIQRPSFVCAIQPLASANMMTRLELLKYFEKFRERGITTLITSFAVSDILEVADSLMVVGEDGRITQEYSRSDIASFPGVAGLRPLS